MPTSSSLLTLAVTPATLSTFAPASETPTKNNGILSPKIFMPEPMPFIYDTELYMSDYLHNLEPRAYPPSRITLAPRKVDDYGNGMNATPDPTPNTRSESSSSSSSRSFDGNKVVVPALVAVALFVVCTLVIMKTYNSYRNRVRPYYPPRPVRHVPEKPCLWEVSLAGDGHESTSPAKWGDLMPVTVEYVLEDDAPSSRASSRASSATRVSSSRCSSRDSRGSFPRSSLEKHSTTSATDNVSHMRVAVLIAMPVPRCGTSSPSCLGLVEI